MLRETYIAAMHQVEGLKLVVTRHYPRGVARVRFDRWLPALAPSRELLTDYRHGLIAWEEYRARFREEILGSAEARAAFRHIIDLARTRDVYLICWEREPPCHRFLLMDLARELSGEREAIDHELAEQEAEFAAAQAEEEARAQAEEEERMREEWEAEQEYLDGEPSGGV